MPIPYVYSSQGSEVLGEICLIRFLIRIFAHCAHAVGVEGT